MNSSVLYGMENPVLLLNFARYTYTMCFFEKVFVALLLVSKISGFKAEKQKSYQL